MHWIPDSSFTLSTHVSLTHNSTLFLSLNTHLTNPSSPPITTSVSLTRHTLPHTHISNRKKEENYKKLFLFTSLTLSQTKSLHPSSITHKPSPETAYVSPPHLTMRQSSQPSQTHKTHKSTINRPHLFATLHRSLRISNRPKTPHLSTLPSSLSP